MNGAVAPAIAGATGIILPNLATLFKIGNAGIIEGAAGGPYTTPDRSEAPRSTLPRPRGIGIVVAATSTTVNSGLIAAASAAMVITVPVQVAPASTTTGLGDRAWQC